MQLVRAISAKNESLRVEKSVMNDINSIIEKNIGLNTKKLELRMADIESLNKLNQDREAEIELEAASLLESLDLKIAARDAIKEVEKGQTQDLKDEVKQRNETLQELGGIDVEKQLKFFNEANLAEQGQTFDEYLRNMALNAANILGEDAQNSFRIMEESIKDVVDTTEQLGNSGKDIAKANVEIATLREKLLIKNETLDETREKILKGTDAYKFLKEELENLQTKVDAFEFAKFGREIFDSSNTAVAGLEAFRNISDAFLLDSIGKLSKIKEVREQALAELAGAMTEIAMAQSQESMNMTRKQSQHDLEQLRNSRKYQKASDKQKKEMEKKIEQETAKKLKKEFEVQQSIRKTGVIMDTAGAIAKAWLASPFTKGMPWTGWIAAMGAAQIATIESAEPPKFQYGGLIGGNPHSQGGTMIEAERGEFIINKNAVDSIGLEALNRINQGNTGGNVVNVSFQGNILSKDFIEDEAIPMIRDAVRRGEDIGVS